MATIRPPPRSARDLIPTVEEMSDSDAMTEHVQHAYENATNRLKEIASTAEPVSPDILTSEFIAQGHVCTDADLCAITQFPYCLSARSAAHIPGMTRGSVKTAGETFFIRVIVFGGDTFSALKFAVNGIGQIISMISASKNAR